MGCQEITSGTMGNGVTGVIKYGYSHASFEIRLWLNTTTVVNQTKGNEV